MATLSRDQNRGQQAFATRIARFAALVFVAFLSAFVMMIFPASAHAATSVKTATDPVSACSPPDIWTISYSGYTEPVVGNNLIKDSSGNYWCLKKGVKSGNLTVKYEKAGIYRGAQNAEYVDIQLAMKWTLTKETPKKVIIYNRNSPHVYYSGWDGSVSSDGHHITLGAEYGAKVETTVKIFKTGTSTEVKDKTMRLYFGDIDRPGQNLEYGSSYTEGVELVSGYTGSIYIGETSGKDHPKLKTSVHNDNPLIQASHVCTASQPCSSAAVMVTSGAKYIHYGCGAVGTMVSICKVGVPSIKVQFHANGGTIADGVHTSGDYKYRLVSSIIQRVETTSSEWATYTQTVRVVDPWFNLLNATKALTGGGNTAGITKTGYHVEDMSKLYYANLNKTTYFNGDNLAASDTNPVTTKRLNNSKEIKESDCDSSGIAQTVTLYINWAPNTYTVVYKGNGATSGETASSKHIYDTAQKLTANGFSRVGYTFQGWATSKEDAKLGAVTYKNKESVKNLSTKHEGTVNLYAVWKANSYTLAYQLDGGSFGADHPNQATYDTAFNVSNPTKANYRFDGWDITGMDGCTHVIGSATTTAASVSKIKDQAFKNLRATSGTVTFTARWTAITTLKLHVDDESRVWRTVTLENLGKPLNVPDKDTNDARKSNCHLPDGRQGLDAWYTDANYTQRFATRTLPAGEVHLYARNFSTITFRNGPASDKDTTYSSAAGTGSIDVAARMPEARSVAYGKTARLPEVGERRVTFDGGLALPSKLRAELGWHAKKACDDTAALSWTSSGDVTLYKKWEASITDGVVADRG